MKKRRKQYTVGRSHYLDQYLKYVNRLVFFFLLSPRDSDYFLRPFTAFKDGGRV